MIDILIFVTLILLSAFFSSSETAFFSLSRAKVRMIAGRGDKTSRIVEKLKRDPQKLLITILIGNNIVNLFTASYATVVATRYFGSAALGIATGVTTFLILIFGEIIPKSFAYAANEHCARAAAWPIYGLGIVFAPVTFFLIKLNTGLARAAGQNASQAEHVTEDEVRTMTRLGVESGKIDYREHEMIENIFRFDDLKADEIMTPWYRVVSLSGIVPVEQIAHFISHEGFSRYPVHDGKNEDNIIGYIHVNDVMKVLNSDERDKPLGDFVLPLTRIPEHHSVERTFRAMIREHSHLFLVHEEGESSELIGLVTLEDCIEEILGEITDETDKSSEGKNQEGL